MNKTSDGERPFERRVPAIGIGFRLAIGKWTVANLSKFDALDITVDHYIKGGDPEPPG